MLSVDKSLRFGVSYTGFPKKPTSLHPKSSIKMKTIFGLVIFSLILLFEKQPIKAPIIQLKAIIFTILKKYFIYLNCLEGFRVKRPGNTFIIFNFQPIIIMSFRF